MADQLPSMTRAQLEEKIHALSKSDQMKVAVIMGPAQLAMDIVHDFGGAVNFTKQLMSHNPDEVEKAIQAMSQFVKQIATLADTDNLKKISVDLVSKAEKAVSEGDAYGISMVAIAAIGEFMPGRAMARFNKVNDIGTPGGGVKTDSGINNPSGRKLEISSLLDYERHRDEIISDGRYQWSSITSDKTPDDVPALIQQAKWELATGHRHERSLFNATPPTPDYLKGKVPENLADKAALLSAGHHDIIDKLKLIKQSQSVPRGPESTLFLHKVGAPPVVISSEITDHLFWARIIEKHIEETMRQLDDKAIHAIDTNASRRSDSVHANAVSKSLSPPLDNQTQALADKFYTDFANEAFLVQLGRPGDTLARYKITPQLLTESGAQSVLAVTNADGRIRFLLGKEEMYGGKIPHAGEYKKISAHEAHQLLHPSENKTSYAKATEFMTDIADKAYLTKHGKNGDSITRFQLLDFKARGDSESLLLVKSTDGTKKVVHAKDEFSDYFSSYEIVNLQQAEVILNQYKNNETVVNNAKQVIHDALKSAQASMEVIFHDKGPER